MTSMRGAQRATIGPGAFAAVAALPSPSMLSLTYAALYGDRKTLMTGLRVDPD
ncbi:hypothetical protein ACIBQ2_16900 [Micromonospora sediminimaris]|uniref:hypothetical protein n=1 Tax=Micromonospora sediminimaris TaxID=547162 RepID=UPI0008E12E06|nr:hypothetical protein [Micromonospora sediminimaris]SFC20978.1 hypothetical protein SAMN05216284_103188 [Micromonospora sediminimaris]